MIAWNVLFLFTDNPSVALFLLIGGFQVAAFVWGVAGGDRPRPRGVRGQGRLDRPGGIRIASACLPPSRDPVLTDPSTPADGFRRNAHVRNRHDRAIVSRLTSVAIASQRNPFGQPYRLCRRRSTRFGDQG